VSVVVPYVTKTINQFRKSAILDFQSVGTDTVPISVSIRLILSVVHMSNAGYRLCMFVSTARQTHIHENVTFTSKLEMLQQKLF
jgi:hypothetical protein